MIDLLKSKLTLWLRSVRPQPVITEKSSLEEIIKLYPSSLLFLEKKYLLRAPLLDLKMSLSEISKQHQLPPPQILFMEIQLHETPSSIEEITAVEAQHLLDSHSTVRVLDVRESWEYAFGSLPKSQALDETVFSEALKNWAKESPILFYCHFGVRSRDAAHEFAKNGFTKLYVIRGGIDAWSTQVDPAIPRYTGAYC